MTKEFGLLGVTCIHDATVTFWVWLAAPRGLEGTGRLVAAAGTAGLMK